VRERVQRLQAAGVRPTLKRIVFVERALANHSKHMLVTLADMHMHAEPDEGGAGSEGAVDKMVRGVQKQLQEQQQHILLLQEQMKQEKQQQQQQQHENYQQLQEQLKQQQQQYEQQQQHQNFQWLQEQQQQQQLNLRLQEQLKQQQQQYEQQQHQIQQFTHLLQRLQQ
jgi:exonuclease VII large subunit